MTGNRIPQSPVRLKETTSNDVFSFQLPPSIFRQFCLCWPNSSLLKSNEIYTTSVQVIQLPHRLKYGYSCIPIHKPKIEMCTLN